MLLFCFPFQDSYIFVSETKYISQIGLTINFKVLNLFLRELMFKCLGFFN